ncbi:23S rRNA (uracil(1939)-C(5))-methyltransferase RlmD [Endozoicomonas sp. SCSIO W0465]|uniref:23S rRNA (uracil(1939)-C(5))-methyltransferase RlmD n=1 Tax=Endozoicomonas sp. SCSIO W0465 TaxID=2918516 RepID=UPI00207592B4|nr:23S rRNA (uracil(1939)-C(5))-methyltransferase RlmD [Endozoicomonas sp. SCSIO W0465]USE39076.1 23S rRNA (uracil(1939)-C(5))-methyltransferase RlmD [Endozoicomonas sp. SCSIO W0465]
MRIDGLSHDGRGIARYHGKTLFIDGALPGETVRARVLEDKRRFINARVTDVLSASPERCEAACSHFHQCGGCSLQYWSHQGQLESKQQIVLDQLRRFANVVPEHIEEPLISPAYGYRHRCRFAMHWYKGRLSLGFREKGSKTICEISECPILVEPLQEMPSLLKSFLPTLKGREAISHAECFLSEQGRGLLLRHIRPLSEEDRALLKTFASAHQLFLYLQGSPERIMLLHPLMADEAVSEALYYRLPESGLNLYFRPQDFTQVNWVINQMMVEQAIQWLTPKASDKVLDLFCGLGNFSLPLAKQSGHVTGVEGSSGSVEQAIRNAGLNGLKNVSFHCVDLSRDFSTESWAKTHYDIVVLDPPRAGADFMIEQLAGLLPDRLLYISCNPATLARDAGSLASYGFKLQRLCVMDMFPQTAHVESMALFVKA